MRGVLLLNVWVTDGMVQEAAKRQDGRSAQHNWKHGGTCNVGQGGTPPTLRHGSWDAVERSDPSRLGIKHGCHFFGRYKLLFLGYNDPRRWCLFWDAKNFFWDTQFFLGIQWLFGGYRNFFRAGISKKASNTPPKFHEDAWALVSLLRLLLLFLTLLLRLCCCFPCFCCCRCCFRCFFCCFFLVLLLFGANCAAVCTTCCFCFSVVCAATFCCFCGCFFWSPTVEPHPCRLWPPKMSRTIFYFQKKSILYPKKRIWYLPKITSHQAHAEERLHLVGQWPRWQKGNPEEDTRCNQHDIVPQNRCTRHTHKSCRDGCVFTHNPMCTGKNPSQATNKDEHWMHTLFLFPPPIVHTNSSIPAILTSNFNFCERGVPAIWPNSRAAALNSEDCVPRKILRERRFGARVLGAGLGLSPQMTSWVWWNGIVTSCAGSKELHVEQQRGERVSLAASALARHDLASPSRELSRVLATMGLMPLNARRALFERPKSCALLFWKDGVECIVGLEGERMPQEKIVNRSAEPGRFTDAIETVTLANILHIWEEKRAVGTSRDIARHLLGCGNSSIDSVVKRAVIWRGSVARLWAAPRIRHLRDGVWGNSEENR